MTGSILVVDGDAAFRRTVAELLSRRGYRVTGAENAAQALVFYAADPADLVLFDRHLADMDVTTGTFVLAAGTITFTVQDPSAGPHSWTGTLDASFMISDNDLGFLAVYKR